ncbi:MAG: NADH-ubiquinone oxidoreductase-F iron-sulfur binding region domain-containing protein [Acidimicrobiales bacterium]
MSDLFIGPDQANDIERAAIDAVLADVATGALGPALIMESERLVRGGATRRDDRRHLLLPALHALQNQRGWISPGGLNYACEQLQVPPAEAYGVATFYEMFRVDDPGHSDDVVHVCVDAACQISGSAERIAELEAAGTAVHASPCLGQCERPVAQFIQGRGKPDRVPGHDGQPDAAPYVIPQQGEYGLRLLRRIGRVDPTSLESYVAAGGYKALTSAFTRGADGVVGEVVASGLMGRGGAAFPTGIKWRAVAAESGPKYVVVNADESEPGTFKDRVLIENDPFALIEAMTIAGFATGAKKGWVYIRGEYPLATQRLEQAIILARDAGFLGQGIARSSLEFDIEVRRGAGAYICGEETALFNSLEGFRGEPRQKPPFPTTNGLFDRPTAINNPETLVNVLDIVIDGGAAYAAIGTESSAGSKLFCLSGHVARPGVYEVDFGATLGELIELAGGVTGDLAAVMLGGAAGSFVGPDSLDMPLTFEGSRAAGASLGSGVIMAFNTTADMPAVVTRVAEFFRNESCGQCVPCRVGTVRQHEVLVGLSAKPEVELNGQANLLDEIDRAMKDASICGLGHTAATAVRSAIDLGLLSGQTNQRSSDEADS